MSTYLDFNEKYNVQIIGQFSNRFPHPKLPNLKLDLLALLIGDAVNIALVSFFLNATYAKYFSYKNKYKIKSNQELFSYGVANVVISFFEGFPFSANYTRSLNVHQIGSRCQVSSSYFNQCSSKNFLLKRLFQM